MITNKKILITGGAGFIGSHLVEVLADNGNEVVVLDNLLRGNKIPSETFKKITFLNEDVTNLDSVLNASVGCDMIFHFAAILGVDIVADNPMETMETEVVGTQNVVKAALQHNVSKIIYASTSGVYGHNALEKSVTEEILVDPRTSYAMAKRYNEIYLASLHEEKGIDSICLRFFNVYGPRQDNRMVVPRFFEQAQKDSDITVYGTGEQTRDFTHINDTIKATLLLAERIGGFEIFNIANENELSIQELAEEIVILTKSKSNITLINAPSKRYDYEVGRRYGSSEKLFEYINYKPETTIIAGLKNTLSSLNKA
ncbi:MAG: NAD-dependent epimerase/dehydratase family protein [Crocinitomicaceae bacterium]|jgi:UDP-glucose 4-epimerase|nr:NAD-dependent epimerase/dehydratase family protein [Crocinitomicaceae bacterium]MBT6515775.1 NAD-dependent epimerase/dehydratase family protein [Crocinitomicaceae bacterium]MDG2329996.1 NAD-dependent epimerase/dehydratase family protein [Flavobacteriales bacterium]